MSKQTQIQPSFGTAFVLLVRHLPSEKRGLVTMLALMLGCAAGSNRRGEQDLLRKAASLVLDTSDEELAEVATPEEIRQAMQRAGEIILGGQSNGQA